MTKIIENLGMIRIPAGIREGEEDNSACVQKGVARSVSSFPKLISSSTSINLDLIKAGVYERYGEIGALQCNIIQTMTQCSGVPDIIPRSAP